MAQQYGWFFAHHLALGASGWESPPGNVDEGTGPLDPRRALIWSDTVFLALFGVLSAHLRESETAVKPGGVVVRGAQVVLAGQEVEPRAPANLPGLRTDAAQFRIGASRATTAIRSM